MIPMTRVLLVLSAILLGTEALQFNQAPWQVRESAVADRKASSRLNAWSLPAPSSFGTFKSTWYNEVENPTARRTVYEE